MIEGTKVAASAVSFPNWGPADKLVTLNPFCSLCGGDMGMLKRHGCDKILVGCM